MKSSKKKQDRYTPSVYGVGFLGEETAERYTYKRWSKMLSRCYNPNDINYPRYGAKGITVSQEFLNYSNFKRWYNENKYDISPSCTALCVDKDILIPNNKVYSPNTCLLIPKVFNTLFVALTHDNYKGIMHKNKTYQLYLFGTTFSDFKTEENVIQFKKAVYHTIVQQYIQNYPNMPISIQEALLKYFDDNVK